MAGQFATGNYLLYLKKSFQPERLDGAEISKKKQTNVKLDAKSVIVKKNILLKKNLYVKILKRNQIYKFNL